MTEHRTVTEALGTERRYNDRDGTYTVNVIDQDKPFWLMEVVLLDGLLYRINLIGAPQPDTFPPRVSLVLSPEPYEPAPCTRPPAGWVCTRGQHPHGSPCAALPAADAPQPMPLNQRIARRIHAAYNPRGALGDSIDATSAMAALAVLAEVRAFLGEHDPADNAGDGFDHSNWYAQREADMRLLS